MSETSEYSYELCGATCTPCSDSTRQTDSTLKFWSFVLAALRALHLDTGVGSALSTSRSKQLKTP